MNYCKLCNLIELLLLSIQSGEKVKKSYLLTFITILVLPQQQESSEVPSPWLRVCGSYASVPAYFKNTTYFEGNV